MKRAFFNGLSEPSEKEVATLSFNVPAPRSFHCRSSNPYSLARPEVKIESSPSSPVSTKKVRAVKLKQVHGKRTFLILEAWVSFLSLDFKILLAGSISFTTTALVVASPPTEL